MNDSMIKVFRGGVTANYLEFETENVAITADEKKKFLRIYFSIASKGGGKTSILLKVGEDGAVELKKKIDQVFPETNDLSK